MRISMNRERKSERTFLSSVRSVHQPVYWSVGSLGIMHAFIALEGSKTSNTANGCQHRKRWCDGNWFVRRNSGGNGL